MSVVAQCLHKRFPTICESLQGFYEPIFEYFNLLSDNHSTRPLIVGISAPQGCGKTTLTNVLVEMFEKRVNKKCVVLSLDDFYLTGEAQDALAQQYASNPLLQHRGSAGTHDLSLAQETLDALKHGQDTRLPRYDKSLRQGRGDRAPEATWPEVKGIVDVVLLEGWMLGFEAVAHDTLISSSLSENNKRHMVDINNYLRSYGLINDIPDTYLLLTAQDISFVYKWRQQAETAMMASGRPGMTKEQVRDFVDRFMPSYELYLPFLQCRMANSRKSVLHVAVNEQREPVEAKFIR